MVKLKKIFTDSSVISLLFSNILIIILAIVQRWEVATVLWTYWMQSVIIGFFNFLRILSLKNFSTKNFTINNQPALPTPQTKIFTALFFAFHYGLFHFIYAVFLFNFFNSGQPLDLNYLSLGGLIFFLNHFFSYLHNKMTNKQKTQNIGQLIFSPYVRIVPMHLIVVFGAFMGQSALLTFLFLKTAVDISMHAVKHRAIRLQISA
ncbi:MAG: DUF6498-containing protein [bacterium]|nr:DUF6498-containing protein [bacterium]